MITRFFSCFLCCKCNFKHLEPSQICWSKFSFGLLNDYLLALHLPKEIRTTNFCIQVKKKNNFRKKTERLWYRYEILKKVRNINWNQPDFSRPHTLCTLQGENRKSNYALLAIYSFFCCMFYFFKKDRFRKRSQGKVRETLIESCLKAVNYFHKKLHFRYLARLWIYRFVSNQRKKQLFADILQNRSSLKNHNIHPVDTGRKLNVHKTFNLRPVSTGHRCLPVNIAKVFRIAFFIEHLRQLLLCRKSLKSVSFFRKKCSLIGYVGWKLYVNFNIVILVKKDFQRK